MTSESSLSDHYQFEGGGPAAPGNDNQEQSPVITDAQRILTTLYETRNPNSAEEFDFTDQYTQDVMEFFDNGMTKSDKLQQINDIIARLKDHIQEEAKEADNDDVDTKKEDQFSKSAISREVDQELEDENVPAGDEYLIWEPRGFCQRMTNFFQNMIEVYFFLVLGVMAYVHPSTNAIFYMLLSVTLFHSMTKDLKFRYLWNLLFLTIILVWGTIVTVFKVFQQNKYFGDDVQKFSARDYKKVVNKLLMLGFSFEWKREALDEPIYSVEKFTLGEMSVIASYDIEILVLICIIILTTFSTIKHFRIKNLTKVTRHDFKNYIRLIDPPDEESDSDVDDEELKQMKLGVSQRMRKKRQIEDLKEQRQQDDEAELKRLKKLIKTNVVGSNRFYKYNQYFFMISLFCVFLESVTYNSLSCVPGMLMILGLGAMYDLRKKYSRYYRTYTFNVMYWVQFIFITKWCIDIFVNIETVNHALHNEVQTTKNWRNTFYQILFGEIQSIEVLRDVNNISISALGKFICLFSGTYCVQAWKTCKWYEIRDKTPGKFVSSALRFMAYIKVREKEDQDELILISIADSKDSKKLKKMMEKSVEKDLIKMEGKRYDSGNVTKKARRDTSKLPVMIMFAAQFFMVTLAYMYHSSAGLVCLCWAIASFILDLNTTLFMSIVVMIPILSLEFIFIYSSRVPKIKNTTFFLEFGKYFRLNMSYPMLEQFFMLMTLLLFYMMIAIYVKRIDNKKQENGLIRFFKQKIKDKSVFFIWLFFACRWAHIVILISLFVKGVLSLNCINNLGYMAFFAIYTAYEGVYRRTGKILIFFSSIFIIGQYFYSLHYQIYMRANNEKQIKNLYWWNMFPYSYQVPSNHMSDPFHIKDGEALYFRLAPHFEEWSNVLFMKILIDINVMYTGTEEKQAEQKMRQEAKRVLQEKTGKLGYYAARTSRIFFGIFNYLIIISLVLVQGIVQPSIVTWFFLALNLINLSYMVKGSSKVKELKLQYWVSNIIKVYSLLVIMVNTIVLAYGQQIDDDDEWFQVKNWLQIIGFKASSLDLDEEKLNKLSETERIEKIYDIEVAQLRNRMIAMITFFLASIYLTNHFSTKIKQASEDQDFGDTDYKKLFEYTVGKKQAREIDLDDDEDDDEDGSEQQQSIYVKKDEYYQQDFIDFYEGVRFTIPFIVYRWIDYWFIMDFLAKYANLLVSFCYVYVCFYMKVNLFNLFNIFLLITFFFNVTIRVGRRAENIQKVAAVQSQCDIQMARIVTKRYKKEAFYEYLAMRKKTWRYMFGLLIFASLLQYPTPLIDKIRKMPLTTKQHQQLNEAILFLFYTGVYIESDEIRMLGLMILGLAVERFAINWLMNRFGCTHFKLQKFVELDQRREAIRYDWDHLNPDYDIERYRRHYFRNDFTDLKKLMQNQTHEEMIRVQRLQDEMMRGMGGQLADEAGTGKKTKYKKTLYGDFVPLKVGLRIVHTVKFSIQLDCGSSDLHMDDQSRKMIDDRDVDYETVPVLKQHKINALFEILKEAVDRKYKISWYKGMQLFLESMIIFLLTISLVAKANIWSVIYLLFIFKFTCTRNKTNLMVRQCSYLCVSLFLQYLLFFLNMTAQSSIQKFPHVGKDEKSLRNYPTQEDLNGHVPRYPIPVFFHFGVFRDNLLLSYMLGIGVDSQQVYSLVFDFFNIFLMANYIFEFRNPILNKQLKKVFWQFPTKEDSEQWARLDPVVQRQVDWIYHPKPLYKDQDVQVHFQDVEKELTKDQKALADAQYKFALDYNHQNEYDLNYMLTNYVDIKYQAIWADEIVKEKKQEIKKNCIYFRLVKQGSQLVYITFHIITIFLVLLMAAMRQSLFAIVYVLILLPKMKDGAEVLKQRDIQQGKELEDLDNEIGDVEDVLKQQSVKDQIMRILKEKLGLSPEINLEQQDKHLVKSLEIIMKMNNDEIEARERHIMISKHLDIPQFQEYTQKILNSATVEDDEKEALIFLLVKKYRKLSGDAIKDALDKLQELTKRRYKLQKSFQKKNAQLKKKDRDQIAKQQWSMIRVIQWWLLTYALLDSTIQIIFQMPIIDLEKMKRLRKFGFRKVWSFDPGLQRYEGDKPNTFANVMYEEYIFCRSFNENGSRTGNCPKFVLDQRAFNFQVMNAFIVAVILLQSEIFSSAGYLKYVTQSNGSMDLIMQLSELKAKSITYVFNNYKIRKILSINRKRESTLKTVERLKEKITRWRQFTRTTLVNQRGPSQFEETDAHPKPQEDQSPTKAEGKDQSELESPKVKFANKDDVIGGDSQGEEEEEDEEDAFVREQKKREALSILPEEREMIHLTLATEFVRSKMAKQRICVRFYIWLQNCFVDRIMFKNQRQDLEYLKQKLAEGSIHVPTELETLMISEAQELIKNSYDNKEGSMELAKILRMNRDKSQNLLNLTRFDKKIKLNQLKMSWDFTRTIPLMLHFIETFFYIIISQSQSMIYLCMLASMYMNAGVISLPYPIAIFGWALLEERRPGKGFWQFIRYYTIFLVAFKFILNLDFFDKFLSSPGFTYYSAYIKTGIYNFPDLYDLIFYMLPEIGILCFLMLHEIKLQLIGLYDRNEEDVETVLDGIERNLQKGDEDAVQERKVELQNMCMARYYERSEEQTKRLKEFQELEKLKMQEDTEKLTVDQIKNNKDYQHITNNEPDVKAPHVKEKIVEWEFNQKFSDDVQMSDKQFGIFEEISKSIYKSSRKFDLDSVNKESKFDELVRQNVVQKTLERDSLTYVEGMRPNQQPNFLTVKQFGEEKANKENWETFSSGDFKEDMIAKFDSIDDRELNNPGFFERRSYFDRIFPSIKVQKPGYDLYGLTTSILGVLAIYIFVFYDSYNYSQMKFEYGKQSVLFPFSMAKEILLIIFIIIIERYANRSDTKKVEEKRLDEEEEEKKKKTFFSNDEMFKRTTTQRSMTVKLKTVKTSDLDMSGDAAQNFLSSMGQDQDDDDIEDGRTKITTQQKTKFIIHWFMLIYSLAYCFWGAPIISNITLYGTAACDLTQREFYGCYNFKDNGHIRFLFVLYMLYLIVSALQISYGFPILKKASSVLQYYNDFGMIIAQVYNAIPFVIEIRCLLDFTFSKTSLDVFQYWQLFFYHFEMFIGWTGNRYYTIKTLGSPTECLDKFIFGVLISSVLLFLLMGPFYLFSTWSPMVGFNPIVQGRFDLNIQINKTLGYNPEKGEMKLDKLGSLDSTYDLIHSSLPYNLYHMQSPFLKEMDKEMWEDCKYSDLTETRDFEPKNVQYCILRRHSDRSMKLSPASMNDLANDVLVKDKEPRVVNISLQQNFQFERSQPADALTAFFVNNRPLYYEYMNDCLTGKELVDWVKFDCGTIHDKSLSTSIIFTQAFNPALVLGQTKLVNEVKQKQKTDTELKHDIKLTYFCDNTWDVRATLHPTQYTQAEAVEGQDPSKVDEFAARWVDPLTCQLNNTDQKIEQKDVETMKKLNMDRQEYFEFLREDGNWSPVVLVIFSMKVATGFIAAYTPTTFYFVLVYGLAATVRVTFVFSTWSGYTYELTNPEAMMKLVECCYMMRHEENLIAEEECYRMLQEIIRQPQLYKMLSGTSLAGSMHPDLDQLSKEQKKKLAQLDNLERKGWDVASLKHKILVGDRKIEDSF